MAGTRNPNLGLVPQADTGKSGWRANLGRSTIELGVPRKPEWWTGKLPAFGVCPGVGRSGKITSLDMLELESTSRTEIQDYFDNSWAMTEVLFSGLVGDQAFFIPPYHGLRHPLIFYYVHPAVLYVNKLRVAGLLKGPINEYFESLFETGVDEMSWDDMSKNEVSWPTIDEAHAYRRRVYQSVTEVIQTHPLTEGSVSITQESPLWALAMSFEHERIHLETSSVLMRELPVNLVKRPPQWPDLHPSCRARSAALETTPENEFVAVEPGHVKLGKPQDFPTFGWDNEYGARNDTVEKFLVSRNLISNAEFLEFVKDGGYRETRYWTQEGLKWRSFRNAKWPSFWVPAGPAGSNLFKLRTIFDVIDMPASWPAIVNYHEAKAYAGWKAEKDGRDEPYRLLSEAEHQRLRQICEIDNSSKDNLIVKPPYNLNLRWGSESPVNSLNALNLPVNDLFGNVWQWLEDHFNPMPGFKVHRFYDDFSTPCFDGEHQMIMGGSFISTGDEATAWARFHFRPHFFQHAGFRLAASIDGGRNPAVLLTDSDRQHNPYETETMLGQYLVLHFGSKDEQLSFPFGPQEALSFPQRCAELTSEWAKRLDIETGRALDIGCAVGGASFKLAETFNEVLGVDLSDSFISTARKLRDQGELDFRILEEGEFFSQARAVVDRETAQRVSFRRADASSLPPEFIDFDAVLIANVICRLPSPMACLSRMSGMRGIVKRGGLLVLTTPFTWMDKFTPKEVWLGGYRDQSGREIWSEEGLKRVLAPDFELLDRRDMPLIIKEHRRKYQYIVSLGTVWRRK